MRQPGDFFCWFKIIIILAIIGAGFFCGQTAWASQNILISEVQITGGAGKTENDFIEIYNSNNFQFNLKGYRLVKRTKTSTADTGIKSWTADAFIPANGYYLWANSGYTDITATADVTTTATISDNNGIAIRFGAADSGVIIDSVAWGEAQNIFIEGSVFSTNPGTNQSLERKLNLDTNNNSTDFFVQENPSPQNSTSEVINPPSPPLQGGQDETASSTSAAENPPNPPLQGGQKNNFGDVVINELVSDPADNDTEWLELYNCRGREIDLSGWWLEDGSKAKTKLAGAIAAAGFKVVEKPAGNLNNNGDLLVLYDATGKIIDQAAYGNWADGDLSNNAPVARDPASLARLFDGYNSYNNANDFAVTVKPTKGLSNIILAEDEISLEAKAKFDFSENIFITEILPNPFGDDAKGEFIELYNAGAREINLAGWSLSNKDDKKVYLEKIVTSTLIKAGEYLALYRLKTKVVLPNDQGEVKLFEPLADKPRRIVAYGKVKEGWSYNLADSGEWQWSETSTPAAANAIKTINHAPAAAFSVPAEILVGQPVMFDSSDTTDADGDELKYAWDFGDGLKNNLANPAHTYLKVGIYKVKLAVSDGKETSEKEKSVKVVGSVGEMNGAETPLNPPLSGGIIINEIYPDPAGADQGQEWLELVNKSDSEINLKNWRVENSNGKFKFKNDLWLEAGDFYLLDNAVSKLAFKNSSDTISLYDDSDELVETVAYAEAAPGESYARGANGKWFWTAKLTPGEENIISVAASQASIKYNVSSIKGNAGEYVETDLENIRELEIGSLVKVKGTVAVAPGILGVQIFYIVGSPGLQIYNYKKDFPALRVGDYVEISGELSQIQGELRLKTKDKADIKIIEHKPPPQALALSCDQVNEDGVGQLITVSGEITHRKSSTLYLDDGNDEILVYIKQNTGIDTKNLATGQTAEITGILSKTASGLRLLPRSQDDIRLTNFSHGLRPQVLGEVAEGNEWEVAERDKKMELFKYLLIAAGGGIIILGILLVRAKRSS